MMDYFGTRAASNGNFARETFRLRKIRSSCPLKSHCFSSTTVELFDVANASLGVWTAPAFDDGRSFLGISFGSGEQKIGRARLTSGNAAPGPEGVDGTTSATDVVVMDGFLFGEPRALDSDLWVAEGPETTAIVAGTNATYLVTVNKTGQSAETGVTVIHPLPAGTTFVSFGELRPDWSATTPAPGSGGTVTVTIPAVPAGTGIAVPITLKVNPDFPPKSMPIDTASVSTVSTDADSSDNSGTNHSFCRRPR